MYESFSPLIKGSRSSLDFKPALRIERKQDHTYMTLDHNQQPFDLDEFLIRQENNNLIPSKSDPNEYFVLNKCKT